MTEEQIRVLDAIRSIREEKRKANVFPDFSITIELTRHTGMRLEKVRKVSLELEKIGLIKTGPTLNYTYCRLTDEETVIRQTKNNRKTCH